MTLVPISVVCVCVCVCVCMLSSLPKEHITVDEDVSIPDSHSVNVCPPAASNSASFHWEWNGLFMFTNP